MDENAISYQLRSEERESTRPLLLKFLPLLRTELEGPGTAIYKYLTLTGWKAPILTVPPP